MTTQEYGLARRMWHQLEPVHAVFCPEPTVTVPQCRQPGRLSTSSAAMALTSWAWSRSFWPA